MMGLAKGSRVVFEGGETIPGSPSIRVDLKQQRTLNPGQANRLNVTFIWRLNRIFLKFINLKDPESACIVGGLWGEKR